MYLSTLNKSTSITYNTFSFVKFPIDPVAMFDIRLRLSNLKKNGKYLEAKNIFKMKRRRQAFAHKLTSNVNFPLMENLLHLY